MTAVLRPIHHARKRPPDPQADDRARSREHRGAADRSERPDAGLRTDRQRWHFERHRHGNGDGRGQSRPGRGCRARPDGAGRRGKSRKTPRRAGTIRHTAFEASSLPPATSTHKDVAGSTHASSISTYVLWSLGTSARPSPLVFVCLAGSSIERHAGRQTSKALIAKAQRSESVLASDRNFPFRDRFKYA